MSRPGPRALARTIAPGIALGIALLGLAAPAHAQTVDVAAQIKLIDQQPADLDRAAWKEKRREAARKLVQSRDKKAVPTLIKLAETETFDIIGEIAIEGLGNMGDRSAVPVLQKIANDPARDKAQRDLAKKALSKLPAAGTTTTGGTTTGGTTTGGTTTTTTSGGVTSGLETGTGGTSGTTVGPTGGTTTTTTTATTTATTTTTAAAGASLLGEQPTGEAPALPEMSDDTLAAYERVTIAGGVATFNYDTIRRRLAFDADVGGTYAKRIEREQMAWGLDLGAHVVAGLINPEGRAQNRGAQVTVTGVGEARFYSGKLYGIGKAAIGGQLTYVSDVDDDNPDTDFKDARTTLDVQVAIGGGYGRLLDVGGAIRVRRLARVLDAARALGKPIDAATAKRLELTWWSLRGARSTYESLVATVAVLREAGILLGEPDAGLTYEILNVLRDSQLFLRPSGLDVQVAIAEGYLVRPDDINGNPSAAGQEGRVEQLLALAGYGAQLEDDKLELSGHGYARLRLFAPDDSDPPQSSPWALGATARMRRFAYGDHGDPIGVFDLGGGIQISKHEDDTDGDGEVDAVLGMRLSGELGFTWWLNQASGFRLAARVAADGGEIFLGATLSATYGFLDATFAAL